jgi:hypothetical protein
MYILAALLAGGFVCNWLVRPVDSKHHAKEEGAPKRPEAAATSAPARVASAPAAGGASPEGVSFVIVVLAWLAVWIPIGWGVWVTMEKAVVLFR